MTEYPLTLAEIVSWFRSKEGSLAGSAVALVNIRERTEYVPAAAADFDGPNTLGQIGAWVSGAFDFHVLRASDGKDIFLHHVDVSALDDKLEAAYTDFLRTMRGEPAGSA